MITYSAVSFRQMQEEVTKIVEERGLEFAVRFCFSMGPETMFNDGGHLESLNSGSLEFHSTPPHLDMFFRDEIIHYEHINKEIFKSDVEMSLREVIVQMVKEMLDMFDRRTYYLISVSCREDVTEEIILARTHMQKEYMQKIKAGINLQEFIKKIKGETNEQANISVRDYGIPVTDASSCEG